MKKKSDTKIRNYVNSFFDQINYSEEVEIAKEKIIKKVNDEYYEELELNKRNAFEIIVKRYHDLVSLVELVDLNEENIDRWFNKEVTTTYEEFNKEFKKERNYVYIITFLILLSLMYLLESLLFYSRGFELFLGLSIAVLMVNIYVVIKHRKKHSKEVISVDAEEKIEKAFDKYTKKSMLWLFVVFLEVFLSFFNLVSLSLNSKITEFAEEIVRSLAFFEVVLFFFLKNVLIMRWLNRKIEFENERTYKKTMRKVFLVSLCYFAIASVIYYGFESYFVFNPVIAIVALYLLYAFAQLFIKSKKFTYNKKGINKLILIPMVIALIVFGGYTLLSRDIWLTQPYINSIPYVYNGDDKIEYDEKTGIYTITSNSDDFKILQLTDIHLGGGLISYDKDLKALNAVYDLINYTKPDLVIVTGDLTYPVGMSSFSFNNTAPVAQFAALMRNTGVPWAFTYGNHDTESVASTSKNNLNELYKSLSWNTSRNLLYPYVQPTVDGQPITGRNNQLIELRNSDGSLNQAIFLIDSNAYIGKGYSKYDYIHDEQVDWYKKEVERLSAEEGKVISSLGFFHIPLQEYQTAYDLYLEGSNKVTYFFGSNEEKSERKVSSSEFPSKLFKTAVELGSTKGFFCGHDHYNNISLEYQGIRLTYGMSIDYLVEPGIARDTKQRGATLITTHVDSSIDIKQIPLDSIKK